MIRQHRNLMAVRPASLMTLRDGYASRTRNASWLGPVAHAVIGTEMMFYPRAAAPCRQSAGQRRPRWIVLAAFGLASMAASANGQTNPPVATVPPAGQPTTPAEIQPGHPATGDAPASRTAPQTAVPAPLSPGAGADTPGGSARSGVIRPPPAAGDPGMTRSAPPVGTMPVIPPPGTAGNNAHVVPK